MSFPQPAAHAEQRLKYACEECHSRKIRCYVSQKGQSGTCTPCHINGRKCLFALKNKTGRPRRPALQQQSKSKSSDSSSTQEWEQASMDWNHRPELLRRQSETLGYDFSESSRFSSYHEDQLPTSADRPQSFSPRISNPSLNMYSGNLARKGDIQHGSPRLLDYDVDCLPDSELSNLFHAGPLSNTVSGSSSDNMSQDCFDVSLISSSAPGPAPLLSTAQSSTHSSTTCSSYKDLIGDSGYNQAFSTSQDIHRRFLSFQSRAFDSTNGYASVEVCQTLECFDVLAKFLQQRMSGHKQQTGSGGLPDMIISGLLYVAVLQAILIGTVLLQADGEGWSSYNSSNDCNYSRRASSSASDQSMSSNNKDTSTIGNLDSILNLTKMEYYITVFNQYLQLFFSANNKDVRSQPSSAMVFDYRACIDTTEFVQSRVRSLLSQSRQAMI